MISLNHNYLVFVFNALLAGQTCGTYYGDCRGLPTYAIIAIISGGILILSVCIRCCIYLSTNKTQPIRRAAPISIGNPSNVQVRVHSTTNYRTAQTASTARVHAVTEDPPPSYTAATAFNSQPPKY